MILDDIVAKTKIRLEREKAQISPLDMKARALQQLGEFHFPFESALNKPGLSYICEVKQASPSKGLIALDFDPIAIAKTYQKIGVDAISILTEPDYFLGDVHYLETISKEVSLPLLRKDFIIDPYMIDQAKVYGASAILLIVSILTKEQLASYIDYAHSLGLSALVEAHNSEEIKQALSAGARIIGVNNRDLRDFTVDVHHSLRYRHLIPDDVIFVSESGITQRSQILALEHEKVQACLIGESMMRAKDPQKLLDQLRGFSN